MDSTEQEAVRDENGENPDLPIDLDNLGEQQSAGRNGSVSCGGGGGAGRGGAVSGRGELRLLACADIWQNLSCVMKTKEGAVIVVDGGRDVDAPHLIEVIQELGGHVDAWLLTHPHSDHVGAITEILNMDPMPISIGKVYYSFLDKEFLGQEQVSRRVQIWSVMIGSRKRCETAGSRKMRDAYERAEDFSGGARRSQ